MELLLWNFYYDGTNLGNNGTFIMMWQWVFLVCSALSWRRPPEKKKKATNHGTCHHNRTKDTQRVFSDHDFWTQGLNKRHIKPKSLIWRFLRAVVVLGFATGLAHWRKHARGWEFSIEGRTRHVSLRFWLTQMPLPSNWYLMSLCICVVNRADRTLLSVLYGHITP